MNRNAAVVALLALAAAPAARAQSAHDSIIYVLAPSSRFVVRTGRSGLLSMAGHEHDIRARAFSGHVVQVPGAPERSHLEITILADSLEVMTPPDTEEIRKVTANMRNDVLEVARFPQIRFVSRILTPTAHGYHIVADLTLHGQTHEVPVDVVVETRGDSLFAHSSFAIRHTQFGMRPFRGGPGGTVRVADRLEFSIQAVAVRQHRP